MFLSRVPDVLKLLHVAARKGAATDPGKDIIQTASPTAHERTQQGLRLLIKRRP